MIELKHLIAAGCAFALGGGVATAAVSYTTPGNPYIENFNTLATTGEDNPWVNNQTIAGVYIFNSGSYNGASGIIRDQKDSPQTETDPPVALDWKSPATYRSTQSSSGSRIYAWGNGTESERALGGITGPSPTLDGGDFLYALVLQNNTGQTLTSFTFGYTGEQWRGVNTAPTTLSQTLTVDYLVRSTLDPIKDIPTSGGDGDYTAIPELTFTAPVTAEGTGALDGNAPANRSVLSTTVSSGFAWAPGDYLILRFWDDDSSGVDLGMAIDDLSFTAVPEPTALAMMACAGLFLSQRRRHS